MPPTQNPYVIVLGNQKGGTGKSTLSVHLITYLARLGFQVGSIDVDAEQGTLTRYLENRAITIQREGIPLPMPDHYSLLRSALPSQNEARVDEEARFQECLTHLKNKDFVVIDTPGNDTYLSSLSHREANTVITPLNDSFIDLDVLARVCPKTMAILRPSSYSEMIWEQKKRQAIKGKNSFDWIVVRNRLSHLNARNKEEMLITLRNLEERIRCRFASGFGERVIFRELFLKGMTLLDLADAGISLSLSHVAAKRELSALLSMLNLPKIQEKLNTQKASG